MKSSLKQNVAAFDSDVSENGGYRYTSNAPFSSIVSNRRLTEETFARISRLGDVIKRVIDIGCGDGTFTSELAERLPHVSFVGFDPAEKAIESAGSHFSNCSFLVGNILEPQTFPDATYDLAIIRGVIHHLSTQKEAIINALKLSKRILIIEPNGNNPILKMIEKTSKYHIEHEEQSFSSDFFLSMARELNLRVAHLGFVGFVPFFFPTLPSKIIYFFQPLLEKMPLLPKYFAGQVILLFEQPENRQ
jgi:ubiquinone/menaquinone biosynthesis C-methylase UbiE